MPTEENGTGELIAYVTQHMTCDCCGRSYGMDDVQVVLRDGIQRLLIATCPGCRHERTVTAYDRPPYEQLRMERVVPAKITREIVTEWTQYLETFTGDFYDLLAEV